MVKQRVEDKYWIKPGGEVAHREYPRRKMIVEEIITKTENIFDNGEKKEKRFIVGIECHWFSEDGKYDRVRFHTTELIKWGESPAKVHEPTEGFPKSIPSSNM